MTKSDVMKEFLKKTVIPVVVALFLFLGVNLFSLTVTHADQYASAVFSSKTERPIIS